MVIQASHHTTNHATSFLIAWGRTHRHKHMHTDVRIKVISTRNDHPYHYILPYASTMHLLSAEFFSANNKRMEQLTPKYYQRRLTTVIFSLP